MRRGITLGIGLAAAMAVGGRCIGDELVKVDGTKVVGRVVAADATTVTMEMNYQGLMVRQKVIRGEIKSLEREVREGPGYCVLPLEGEVGVEITAESLNAAIGMARRDGARIIVLRIKSGGGSVPEMGVILETIARASKDIHFVAYVEEAMSAAAVIAMTCPEIYMAPNGRIGAAVPFKIGPEGTPEDIEQKFFSAVTSEMRAAAEFGKHPTIFVRGMSEAGIELVLRKENGKIEVVETTVGKEIAGDEVIKPAGKILSMTANEAERYGLSAGTIASAEDVRGKLGVKVWFHAGVGAEAYLANTGKATRDVEKLHAMEQLTEVMGDTMESCEEKQKDIEGKIAQLSKQLSVDEDAVHADYDKAMQAQHKPSELEKYKEMADADAKKRLIDLHAAFDMKMGELQGALRAVLAQENVLKGMQQFAPK